MHSHLFAEVDMCIGIAIETELRALPWQLQGMVVSDDDQHRAFQQAARQRELASVRLLFPKRRKRPLEAGRTCRGQGGYARRNNVAVDSD
jgi:hypothetical protein